LNKTYTSLNVTDSLSFFTSLSDFRTYSVLFMPDAAYLLSSIITVYSHTVSVCHNFTVQTIQSVTVSMAQTWRKLSSICE